MLSGAVIRLFILLAVFASVFLLVQVVLCASMENRAHLSAVNKRLKMIARGSQREEIISHLRKNDTLPMAGQTGILGSLYRAFRANLMMAAVPFTASQVAIAMATLTAFLFLVIATITWASGYSLTVGITQLLLAVSAAIAIAVPLFIVNFLAQRRRRRMQTQFPVALDIFVRALRSGHPVASAIELLTQEMEDPIGSEFGLVSDEVSYGADLTESLSDMAERWDLDDIRMFVVSLGVQNETGGNLAEILENLSKVIRERAGLYLKVRALSSEGRMTGWMLTVLPVIAFVLLFMINPPFYLGVAKDPIFYIGFPMLLVWYVIGVISIRKMVNLKV